MDNIIYESIKKYFIILAKVGCKSYDDVYKILYLNIIRDFVYNDFRGFITEDDYRIIEKSLYCIIGTSCLVPYPQFCNNKTMNNLHLGSITELSHRLNILEEKINSIEETNTQKSLNPYSLEKEEEEKSTNEVVTE